MHAEVRLGDACVMRGAPLGETRALLGSLSLYVHAVDAVDTRALNTGAPSTRAPADQSYGDRSAGLKAPLGNP
jgi:uncharacterized glyoxalase superfamily protein PhnB